MSRIVLKKKDIKYRKNFSKNEIKVLKIKVLKRSNYHKLISTYFKNLGKSSIIKVRNRCLLNNCSKAVFKDYKLNRISLREQILMGNMLGMKKASW